MQMQMQNQVGQQDDCGGRKIIGQHIALSVVPCVNIYFFGALFFCFTLVSG